MRTDPREPRLAVVKLELLPGHERSRIADAVQEQDPIQMVDLVLEGSRTEPLEGVLAGLAVAVEVAHPHRGEAVELAAEAGYREAALDDRQRPGPERLDHRVDHDGQRDRRLVGVASVPALRDLGYGDAYQLADLVRREAGSAGCAHRRDHRVDQPLQPKQLVRLDLARALAQHGIADVADRQGRHSRIGIRTPRSSATSTARS